MATNHTIIARTREHLIYLLEGYSIRDIAKITGWSKTTVHNDLTLVAPEYFPEQAENIKVELKCNYLNRGKISARKYKEKIS